jgi:hypothetical protein
MKALSIQTAQKRLGISSRDLEALIIAGLVPVLRLVDGHVIGIEFNLFMDSVMPNRQALILQAKQLRGVK